METPHHQERGRREREREAAAYTKTEE